MVASVGVDPMISACRTPGPVAANTGLSYLHPDSLTAAARLFTSKTPPPAGHPCSNDRETLIQLHPLRGYQELLEQPNAVPHGPTPAI